MRSAFDRWLPFGRSLTIVAGILSLQEAALKQRRLDNIQMRPKPPAAETAPRKTREAKETGSKRIVLDEYSEYDDEDNDVQVT